MSVRAELLKRYGTQVDLYEASDVGELERLVAEDNEEERTIPAPEVGTDPDELAALADRISELATRREQSEALADVSDADRDDVEALTVLRVELPDNDDLSDLASLAFENDAQNVATIKGTLAKIRRGEVAADRAVADRITELVERADLLEGADRTAALRSGAGLALATENAALADAPFGQVIATNERTDRNGDTVVTERNSRGGVREVSRRTTADVDAALAAEDEQSNEPFAPKTLADLAGASYNDVAQMEATAKGSAALDAILGSA